MVSDINIPARQNQQSMQPQVRTLQQHAGQVHVLLLAVQSRSSTATRWSLAPEPRAVASKGAGF